MSTHVIICKTVEPKQTNEKNGTSKQQRQTAQANKWNKQKSIVRINIEFDPIIASFSVASLAVSLAYFLHIKTSYGIHTHPVSISFKLCSLSFTCSRSFFICILTGLRLEWRCWKSLFYPFLLFSFFPLLFPVIKNQTSTHVRSSYR